MKKKNLFLVLILMLGLLLPTPVKANAAEPPCFMVMVEHAPDDLELYVTDGKDVTVPVKLRNDSKAWERYYRFYYHDLPGIDKEHYAEELKNMTLLVKYGSESFSCQIPSEGFEYYNNLLTLDLETKTLKQGEPDGRSLKLFALRLGLTLLIEGIVLFLFGYRKPLSWIFFIAINVMTQGFLNVAISGPHANSYWLLMYYFLEVIIFAVEMILYALIIREHGWKRAIGCAFLANLASLVLGGVLIAYLPV